jgi:MtN3 and saliva related transmembrane protein
MDLTVALGLLAGGLTTVSFVPQVIKIWKTKSAEDVSLKMFLALCAG